MGRGVRSNDDYCVVLLCGAKLTSRVKSPEGRKMLTGATQAQLELSTNLAKKLDGTDIAGIAAVVKQCLARDESWVKVSKRALLKAQPETGLSLDLAAVATRQAFDLSRVGDHPGALQALRSVMPTLVDDDARALFLVHQAEIAQHIDPMDAQKILLAAHKLNRAVLKPIDGIAYQKLAPAANQQAAAVQAIHRQRFLEAADRVLHIKALTDDLIFKPDTASRFELAVHELALLIGLGTQRPEKDYGHGPDNLWAFPSGDYLVIECKNGATSHQGISKHDLGQLGQAVDWFEGKYTKAAAKTPLVIHPLRNLGPGAAILEGARVMTEKQLDKLRDAITDFAKALGDANVLNDTNRIAHTAAARQCPCDDPPARRLRTAALLSGAMGAATAPFAVSGCMMRSGFRRSRLSARQRPDFRPIRLRYHLLRAAVGQSRRKAEGLPMRSLERGDERTRLRTAVRSAGSRLEAACRSTSPRLDLRQSPTTRVQQMTP